MKRVQAFFNSIMIYALAKCCSLIKCFYVFGTFFTFFSASSMLLPLAGALGGLQSAFYCLLFQLGAWLILKKALTLHFLAYCIPGFCASLYWTSCPAIIRFLIPVAAIVLFVCHPIGFYAAPYSFYWIIPIFALLYKPHNLFFKALASTFGAHAVGSVIWLYTTNMSAGQWLSLIPVVIIERIFFAIGMVICYKAIMNITHYCKLFVPKEVTVLSLQK